MVPPSHSVVAGAMRPKAYGQAKRLVTTRAMSKGSMPDSRIALRSGYSWERATC